MDPWVGQGKAKGEARVRGGEGSSVEGRHGAPVTPQDAVFYFVEGEEVTADVVAGVSEELVALEEAARDALDHSAVDHKDVVDVGEEGELLVVSDVFYVHSLKLCGHQKKFGPGWTER